MKNSLDFIHSGILTSYVLGLASDEEKKEVEEMALQHPAVQAALDELNTDIEKHALQNAIPPPALVKPFVLATIDFMKRMYAGEAPGFPPILDTGAKASDYSEWIDRPDMVIPENFKDIHAKIIGYTPQASTAIVWLKDTVPGEVHTKEYERFLILEGTCTITIEEDVHNLVPGDYLAIPLFKNHYVTVTSSFPCKIILQRVAA